MLELFFYNLFVKSYHLTIRIAALWNKKARLWQNGRKHIFDFLQKKISQNTTPIAWFHCASLGEFEQARPVLEKFREAYPHFQIVLTFYSPSGYEVRKNYPHADFICYLPEDSPQNAKKFLKILNPTIVFWTKYEFWYHYLHQAKQKNIPVVLFSAVFNEKQLFFRKSLQLHRKMLYFFQHIFVQDEKSLMLLQNIGIKHCSRANDTRFDRVWQIVQQSKEIEKVRQFKNDTPLLIVGSAWQEDWQVIENFLQKFTKPLKLIIAPHEIDKNFLNTIQKAFKKSLLFSQMHETVNPESFDVLIVDTIGHLAALYRYGDFAWVGGGFKQGLHNILEPATFGMPIFFGNKAFQKFREAQELIQKQGAFAIKDAQELFEIFIKLYENNELRFEKKRITQNYVQEHTGGAEKILAKIAELL